MIRSGLAGDALPAMMLELDGRRNECGVDAIKEAAPPFAPVAFRLLWTSTSSPSLTTHLTAHPAVLY
jgi:hypothetical protein